MRVVCFLFITRISFFLFCFLFFVLFHLLYDTHTLSLFSLHIVVCCDTSDSPPKGLPQSEDITDEDLEMIMDRRDLLGEMPPNKAVGPGWEEVEDRSGMSLLGNVNKE